MKAEEIRSLISFISESGLDEVEIETEKFKLRIKRNSETKYMSQTILPPQSMINPMQMSSNYAEKTIQVSESSVAEVVSAEPKVEAGKNYVAIKSPMIGTFYRSSSPQTPAFISVGDKIEKGKVVGIIEAMKLFNEIESDLSGTIVKVLVENASPVEYDQDLFLVELN
ncbi:MAG: acetyl-CoA carboxylase biotin carboxyl carrier protein [Bacteroidetes bacterium]|nr:MAG: acetyl-CoA carboxylase biotin carboxyl carrier protein [Bacteroidota bacterium]